MQVKTITNRKSHHKARKKENMAGGRITSEDKSQIIRQERKEDKAGGRIKEKTKESHIFFSSSVQLRGQNARRDTKRHEQTQSLP